MSLFPTLLPMLLPYLLQFRDISQGMSITLLPQHLCICLCISAFASACKALLPAPLQDWIHVTFRSPLCVTSGWPSRAPPLPQTALHRITLFIFFIVLDTFGYSVIYICMCCLSLLSEMQPPWGQSSCLCTSLFPIPGAGPDTAVEQIQLSKCLTTKSHYLEQGI